MSVVEQRSPVQDRKALLSLRHRLFAQGLGLLADSPDSSHAASIPSVAASMRESIDDSIPQEASDVWHAPSVPSSTSDRGADEDATALIRRRLFSQHPSHNPLDTSESSVAEDAADLFASPDSAGGKLNESAGDADTAVGDAPRDTSADSTIGPISPEQTRSIHSRETSPAPMSTSPPDGVFQDLSAQNEETVQSIDVDDFVVPKHIESDEYECALHIDDIAHVKEFERLNERLVRHGFSAVTHRLQTAESGKNVKSCLVADGSGLWKGCLDVLAAYEDRGKRLRDALIAERAESRKSQDTRVNSLLQENKRLEHELQRIRKMASSAPPAPQNTPAVARSVAAEKEISELTLKLKAAEALARHREREVEQVRARLELAVAEGARRQEREREALSKPLKRRAATRDDPLLAVAVAHQARAESLQSELSSVSKHSHTLAFQLEAAQEKCRKLEAQQQFKPSGRSPSSSSTASPAESAPEIEHLRQVAAKGSELRARAEEQLQEQAAVHARDSQIMGQRLHELEVHAHRLETERREAQGQPSAGELKWQSEALRLRDELVEARRAWRSADPRSLMRRDKEIRSLGLNARQLEDGAKKADLVAILLDLCRLFKVGDLAEVVPQASALATLRDFHSSVADVLEELGHIRCSGQSHDLLQDLRAVAKETCKLRAEKASREEVLHRETASRGQQLHVAEEGVRAIAAELRLPQGAAASECLQRVTELRVGEAVLEGLAAQLKCHQKNELPQCLEDLLRLCDERVAAQRIVDALQKLLRAESIQEVLPALREVLDVSALRRRAMEHDKKGSISKTTASFETTQGRNRA